MAGAEKERFSITLDEDLLQWIEKLTEKKIFSNRVHAIELCLAIVRDIGFDKLLSIREGRTKILYLSETENKIIQRISTRLDMSEDEAAKLLIIKGYETEQEA